MGFIMSIIWVFVGAVVLYGVLRLLVGWTYRVPQQGQAIVVTGAFGFHVAAEKGVIVLPIIERMEMMDISVKRIEIHRHGATGLICKDNLRADIKVTFYVKVDCTNVEHVRQVAQSLGCERASDAQVLAELFEPKFSDALKAAGREFNFEELFNKRVDFRSMVKKHVGTDLNGYILDDAAIDLLEQTKIDMLDPQNVLDAQGIKLIKERTKEEHILSNAAEKDEEREINKKNVETREIILQQNKELAEAEQKQMREVAEIKAREEAATIMAQQGERLKSEKARIATEEEVRVAEENKNRQIIVAQRNKERTDGVEQVRVQKDREIEDVERQKIVTLADIERVKAVETEQKNIQEVIRARVMVQKDVVAEEQRLKDTEAFATADRDKKVLLTMAEAEAEQALIGTIKAAEAAKKAGELKADQDMLVMIKAAEAAKKAAEMTAEREVIEAEGEQNAATKIAAGKKAMAEGITAEQAATGLADARVIEAKAEALKKQGTAEADVLKFKFQADADGIVKKAEAMKLFNEAGKEHEEFKLRLNVDKEINLAEINIQKDIAQAQALVVAEALKNAKVDIVGGETEFFDRIVKAITAGKAVDRTVNSSRVLSGIRDRLFDGDGASFAEEVRGLVSQFGLSSRDLRDLSIAAALAKMTTLAETGDAKSAIDGLLNFARREGMSDRPLTEIIGGKN